MRKEWTKNEETNARQTDTWFERLEKSRCNIGVQDMRAVDGDETGFIWTKACNQPFPRTGRRVKLAASTLQVVYIAFKMPVYPVRFIDARFRGRERHDSWQRAPAAAQFYRLRLVYR